MLQLENLISSVVYSILLEEAMNTCLGSLQHSFGSRRSQALWNSSVCAAPDQSCGAMQGGYISGCLFKLSTEVHFFLCAFAPGGAARGGSLGAGRRARGEADGPRRGAGGQARVRIADAHAGAGVQHGRGHLAHPRPRLWPHRGNHHRCASFLQTRIFSSASS